MRIVRKPAFAVVGIRVEASWSELWTRMPEAWSVLFSRVHEIDHRTDTPLMDVCLDKRNDTYVQLVGAEVSTAGSPPDGMQVIDVPEQTYVHYRHTGGLQEIATSFGMIYEWAKEHKHHVSDFKIDVGYSAEGDHGYHDLYVRVVEQRCVS